MTGANGLGPAGASGWLTLGALGAGRGLARRAVAGRKPADLDGEVALVTGGSRGLGFLLARELARQGCRLVICARDAAELDRARRALEADGADVVAIPCDVADQADVERLVERAAYHHGRVDILINNAGIIQVGPVSTMTPADFEQAMGVMFWGVLYPTLAVLPGMRARGQGRILNITSIGGKVAVPHLAPYSAAKFAAVGLSEGLRAELAREGITVTTIAPGLMRTGSYVNAFFKGRRESEFRWFSLGSSLPLASMDAERAARQIVRALRRGESERVLSIPATLLARFHGLFPGLTADIMALVNRLLLPGESDDRAAVRGLAVQPAAEGPVLKSLTSMGQAAARRFLEVPEAGPTPDPSPRSATAERGA